MDEATSKPGEGKPGTETLLQQALFTVGGRRVQEIDSIINVGRRDTVLIGQLDNELRCLDDLVCQLRARRNACCPLFRLPPEIFSEIVTIVAIHSPPGPLRDVGQSRELKGMRTPPRTLGWITLGHVCRQFRALVLNLPTLWASAVTSLPNTQEIFLERAKAAPLTIMLDTDKHPIPLPKDTIKFAVDNFHRARVFEVRESGRMPVTVLTPAAFKQLEQPQPLPLERMIAAIDEVIHFPDGWVDRYNLPPLNAPRLQHLSFKNMYFPSTSTSLTYLELVRSGPSALVGIPPPADDILTALRFLPRLQVLRLIKTIPVLTDLPARRRDEAISLPHLTELWAYGPRTCCLALWSHLIVPVTANLRFRVDYVDNRDLDFEDDGVNSLAPFTDPHRMDFLRALSTHVRASRDITGLSIFDDDAEESIRICLCVREENAIGDPDEGWTGPFARGFAFRLDVTFYRWECQEPHFVDVFECVVAEYGLAGVAVLELGSLMDYGTRKWRELLDKFKNVHTLALDGMPTSSLMKALGTPASDSPLLLPALKSVQLSSLVLYQGTTDQGDYDFLDGMNYQAFLDLWTWRSAQERGLQQIILDNLDMEPAHPVTESVTTDGFIARLKEIVPSVELKEEHPQYAHSQALLASALLGAAMPVGTPYKRL
ncbi:hypothetical protein OF83DRAFT_1083645 [Amylostereum chailletii]|nr:hypothetical protein OF83DRAFT_1083645 [Amylostereum chailletii]